MRFCLAFLFSLFMGCYGHEAVRAQSVVLRPVDVLPGLTEANAESFYINGPMVHGLGDDTAQAFFPLGGSAKYLLALVTLRLADKGMIDLDESIAKAVPELLDYNPFEVAITPAHLLAETGGFGWPPAQLGENAASAPLRYFLISVRGAGQISVPDPVGWQLLAAFLEKRAGTALSALIQAEILTPLGIEAASVRLHAEGPRWQVPLASSEIKAAAIPALLRPLMRGPHLNGGGFLSRDKALLLGSTPLWDMHPLGAARHAGLTERRVGNHRVLTSDLHTDTGLRFMHAPGSDVTFVALAGPSASFWRAAIAVLEEHTPPNFDRASATAAARQNIRETQPGFFYNCAKTVTGLAARALRGFQCSMDVAIDGRGRAIIFANGDGQTVAAQGLEPAAPNAFLSGAPEVPSQSLGLPSLHLPLVFSQFGRGGYAMLGDWAFVRADYLGYLQTRAIDYLHIMIIVLLSAGLHLRSRTSIQWRRFAAFSLIGTTLVSIGIIADLFFWPTVLYDLHLPWLVVLWRVGLSIGLMLILSLPMLAFAFIRQQNMPTHGIALLFAGPHLGLISLAAIGLFLTTVIWGLAGTFSAY